jgi:hypothetical protein
VVEVEVEPAQALMVEMVLLLQPEQEVQRVAVQAVRVGQQHLMGVQMDSLETHSVVVVVDQQFTIREHVQVQQEQEAK